MLAHLKNINNLIFILGVKKTKLIFLLLITLLAGFIELLGLSLIAPYISTIFKMEEITSLTFFEIDKRFEKNFLLFFSLFLIFIFLIKATFAILIKWYIANFSYRQFAILQKRLLLTYQKINYEDFIQRNITEYIRNIRELCSHTLTSVELVLKAISEIIIIFFVFLFLLIVNFKTLITLMFIISPIILFYEKILKPLNVGFGKKRINAIKGIYKNADSGLRGAKEIKFLEKDLFFRKLLFKNAIEAADAQTKSVLISESPRYVFEFFLVGFALVTMYFLSISSDDMSRYLPITGVFLLAGIRILPSISIIVNCFNRIAHLSPSTEVVLHDLKEYYISEDKQNSLKKNNKTLNTIELKDIEFKYKNSKNLVFKNLNFKILKNDCIGIMGESGSGKTTLIDILLGLLEPQKGSIFINGYETNKNLSSKYYGNVAYLPQEPVTLDESIETNITLEHDRSIIDEKKMYRSINKVNLASTIDNLSNGVKSLIGEDGIRLSGGQNKRLALARTLYHEKDFLILDEATSSLDKDNENFIAEQIKILKGNHTIIIISHQLNLLKYCNKIYKIDNKKIIEKN